jgi:hypothetical protein
MARTIVLDSDVIEQIGRGNQGAANSLKAMISNGDTIYVTQQSYKEMVVDPAIPRTGAAKREFLRGMNIQMAPAGDQAARQQVLANNIRDGGAVLQPGEASVAANARAINAEVWSFDRAFRNNANGVTTTLGVQVAPECRLPMATAPEDYRVARQLAGLPPLEIDLNGTIRPIAGRGASPTGNPFASTTHEGFDPEGTNLKVMGGIMALGAIVGWLDDYFIDEGMKKDIAEWEPYIRSRQPLDPATGFLLVAIIKRWQPRDAAYATRSYVGLDKIEAENLDTALYLARKNILPGLSPPTDTVSYEYRQMWIPPLAPKPRLSSAAADEKAYGSAFWYPGFRRLRQSLEPPADYGEALSVLVGSWMLAMIRMLDHLLSYSPRQFNELKGQLINLREPINQARVGLAFRAVESHRSDSSFGLQTFFDGQSKAYFDMLPPEQRREIADWVESGSGALKHVMQGQWEVVMNGDKFLYSFRLAGTVIYRNAGSGEIAGEGTWDAADDGVRVRWTKTGTVDYFPAPLRTENQPGKSVTKWGGTFELQARKVNPYP